MITIFTRRNCKSCTNIQSQLRKELDIFNSTNLNDENKNQILFKTLCCEMVDPALQCVKLSGSFSVPQIFFNEGM